MGIYVTEHVSMLKEIFDKQDSIIFIKAHIFFVSRNMDDFLLYEYWRNLRLYRDD